MSRDHDTVTLLQAIDSSLLEVIKFKWVLNGRILDQIFEVIHFDSVLDNPLLFGGWQLCILSSYCRVLPFVCYCSKMKVGWLCLQLGTL